jgi:hypothetical protein
VLKKRSKSPLRRRSLKAARRRSAFGGKRGSRTRRGYGSRSCSTAANRLVRFCPRLPPTTRLGVGFPGTSLRGRSAMRAPRLGASCAVIGCRPMRSRSPRSLRGCSGKAKLLATTWVRSERGSRLARCRTSTAMAKVQTKCKQALRHPATPVDRWGRENLMLELNTRPDDTPQHPRNGLITRRSQVRILPPLCRASVTVGNRSLDFFGQLTSLRSASVQGLSVMGRYVGGEVVEIYRRTLRGALQSPPFSKVFAGLLYRR